MSSVRSVDKVQSFLEDGCWHKADSFYGAMRDCWANDDVTADRTLRNPVIAKEHVDAFYKSLVFQKSSQKITGKQNIVIFQCDSRSPGTVNSKDRELEKSFVFFHNFVKYRGQALGYFFFDAKEFGDVG
eukprot:2268771-Karenia_brevis.AAC.1